MQRSRTIAIGIILAAIFFEALLFWPLPDRLLTSSATEPLRILDRHGTLLYEARASAGGTAKNIALKELPQDVLDAVIATEDRAFYSHPGISLRGIARALLTNIRAGHIVAGGSTITQQLVRIRMRPQQRGYLWKIEEAYLALRLDLLLTKDDILAAYLNEAYFGHQAYGIAAATQTYFGKNPKELALPESVYLVGLLQAPSSFDPFEDLAAAKKRQETVLAAMRGNGILSESEEKEAAASALTLAENRVAIEAPHFVFWLLQGHPDLADEASTLVTTIDLPLQKSIESIVERNLAELRDKNVTAAAVVVLNATNGDLLTMVGSADYFNRENDGAVNVAVAPRQPGSALKPFTYALALLQGNTPATTVADIETRFFTQEGNPYIPRNYDYGYHGLVRYREALANSYNIAAVKVLERVGVPRLLEFLRDAGITTLTEIPEYYGLALTLGDGEVTLLELARAYGIFARGGSTLQEQTILEIVPKNPAADAHESPRRETEGKQILDPRVAWLIADILSDNQARLPEFGEAGPLTFNRTVAAKTGTTRNSRDNWTIGFTPERIVGVWVGNADNTPMRDTSGVTGAGPIFHEVMLEALTGIPDRGFPRPVGITKRTICRLSGKSPTPACPQTIEEYFVTGTEPTEEDDLFRTLTVDIRNGLLAGEACDARFKTERTFAMFPPELRTWARENGWQMPPMNYSPLCEAGSSTSESSFLAIEQPHPGASFALDPLIPDANERIIFTARASTDVHEIEWFVDSVAVGVGTPPAFRTNWNPSPGTHRIEARAGNRSDVRTVTVLRASRDSLETGDKGVQ